MQTVRMHVQKATAARRGNAPARRVACQAEINRRALLAIPALVPALSLLPASEAQAVEKMTMQVSQLSAFQKKAQREAYTARVLKTLGEYLEAEDASACVALLLHEASTYDVATKKGGLDGSIFLCPEEAGRPENASLKPIIEKLRKAKAALDAQPESNPTTGSGPLSYSDLIVASVKVSTRKSWRAVKTARAQDPVAAGIISDSYGTAYPLTLGRVDNASCETPSNGIPAASSSVADITAWFAKLGNKDAGASSGLFPKKAPFSERPAFVLWTAAAADPAAEEARFAAANAEYADIKKKYDDSRETLTRTNYEVDFIDYVERLSKLGAKFDADAYLHPEESDKIRL